LVLKEIGTLREKLKKNEEAIEAPLGALSWKGGRLHGGERPLPINNFEKGQDRKKDFGR